MKNEAEVKIKKWSNFSDTQWVRTTIRTLLRFWGGSKFIYNIDPASDVDRNNGISDPISLPRSPSIL